MAWTWATAACNTSASSSGWRFARLHGLPICSNIWKSTAATRWANTTSRCSPTGRATASTDGPYKGYEVRGSLRRFMTACLLAGLASSAFAEGIYTCVDSKGRRLTADRPMMDCIDREQVEISPSGKVLRRIAPSLTPQERAAEEEKVRKAAEERNRVLDEKKRDRALVTRFPDRAVHDKERDAALATADAVIATAAKRGAELVEQRRKLDTE